MTFEPPLHREASFVVEMLKRASCVSAVQRCIRNTNGLNTSVFPGGRHLDQQRQGQLEG